MPHAKVRFDMKTLPAERLMAELSLWSADLTRLADEITRVDEYADIYHIDVSDGHFSPAFLFFPDVVAQIRQLTHKPLHVHLMVDDRILLEQIDQFAEAGADIISVHAENQRLDQALTRIEEYGCVPGLVLQLPTPVSAAETWLPRVGILTLLGTLMGVKGQDLSEQACGRLHEARQLIGRCGAEHRILLAADGAIRSHTVPALRESGADTVVMGSLAFNASDYRETMLWSRALR
ncbi:ribulose-phosphate 3-epimerase [Candidatus Pantoea multigeneris]|uniref:Ribulose-phosphate 3-epimerase n=1 Tax=Candidatus Pantoea multigeneris TaxID=2608357 RepID=A0ABX0RAA5_9GAMM|nr:ribulose-phosphate 3-epimerase [Pantoea multigeneris]NIF22298.1 ribulose-phosphate 3-epimerase [Pantoea multigeneris]